jgi:hypothetical protein
VGDPRRIRQATAGGCLLCAAMLLVVGVATASADLRGLSALVAVAAAGGLGLTLLDRFSLLAPSAVGLALPALVGRPGVATGVAAALTVAMVELAGWQEDARSQVPMTGEQLRARAVTTLGLALGAAAVTYALLGISTAPPPRGAWAEISGLVAVLAIAAIVAGFAGRRSRP